jgi:CubicO group peptidase (beta-lactamase class C family)
MPRLRFTAALTALLLLSSFAGPARSETEPLKGLDEYVRKALQDWEVPGLALAVVKDDRVILAKGYGIRKLGEPAPVDERTMFAIGSATKAFTAAALGMLVDEGRIKWDDPVTKYLPEFQLSDPYVTREITIRDLLCHRSGLERNELVWYGSANSRAEVLRRMRYVKPGSSFRSKFGYQNVMYLAAGQIIPAVAKTGWDDFVQQKIFKPLGMNASVTSTIPLNVIEDVATPHQKIEEKVQAIPWRNIDNIGPAGSINSNVLDMAQWLRLQLGQGKFDNKQLLSSGIMQQMHAPQMVMPLEGMTAKLNPESHFLCYGLGWFLQDYRGKKVVQHAGNIDGMSALVAMLPEEKLGLVILTNLNGSRLPGALMYRIFDAYLKVPARDWSADLLKVRKGAEEIARKTEKKREEERVKGTRPTLPLEKYAGTYKDEIYGELKIIVARDKLVVRFGPVAGDLEHWNYDTFRAIPRDKTMDKMMLTFSLDSKGKVEQVKSSGGQGDGIIWKRAPDPAEAAPAITLKEEELRKFAGKYELKSPPLEVSLELVDGRLKANMPGQSAATLVPIQPARFRVDGAAAGVFVQFDLADGTVKSMTLEQESGVSLQFTRKP